MARPRRNAGPTPGNPTELPVTAKALAAKAKDLEALRSAVVDAAGISAGLWLSYLFVLLYLLIAAGSVTHRDLLLESPIKLPFLGVELPLTGFFWLGPALFLIVHAYVLVHFVLLAQKVGIFHAELGAQIDIEDVRARLRRQLPSNIFVQFLAGPAEVREGVLGLMLRLIAQISLVIGPVALLVFFQLQFLPYHSSAITWWHRFAVLIDLVLLWVLWPSVARGEMARPRDVRGGKAAVLVLVSFIPILLVFWIATFPGERLDRLPSVPLVPTKWPIWYEDGKRPASAEPSRGLLERASEAMRSMDWTSPHELLFGGKGDIDSRLAGLLSNRLIVLPGINLIDYTKFDSEAKFEAARETISLRDRNLEHAILIGADLRKVNFGGSQLLGASLDDAQLQGTIFTGAQLAGASLNYVKLYGADLRAAQLQGVELHAARLHGVNLSFAQLQGASLTEANLQGADLRLTNLRGADLTDAQLQGADLTDANLQVANLGSAQLQGAILVGTKLQGADLTDAHLQGAYFRNAQLQGVDFAKAKLRGAQFVRPSVWRADARRADKDDVGVSEARLRADRCPGVDCQTFEELRQMIELEIPEGTNRRQALERVERLNPTATFEEEAEMAILWATLQASSPARDVFEKTISKEWREAGCTAEGAPFVLQKLVQRLGSMRTVLPRGITVSIPLQMELAGALLNESHCPGVRGLPDSERAILRTIRDSAVAPPPSPSRTRQ